MPTGPAAVTLVPFTRDLLPAVQPWFRDDEVRRRLGGPEWPDRELRLLQVMPGQEFRGRVVLRAHSWVALDDAGVPVAKVGGDVYDRWCRFDGSVPEADAVSDVEAGPAMGLAYVVDPARRRRGFARAALRAALARTEVEDVRLFAAGIDHDNEPSRRCVRSVGFDADTTDPDWEGTVHYLLRR